MKIPSQVWIKLLFCWTIGITIFVNTHEAIEEIAPDFTFKYGIILALITTCIGFIWIFAHPRGSMRNDLEWYVVKNLTTGVYSTKGVKAGSHPNLTGYKVITGPISKKLADTLATTENKHKKKTK